MIEFSGLVSVLLRWVAMARCREGRDETGSYDGPEMNALIIRTAEQSTLQLAKKLLFRNIG